MRNFSLLRCDKDPFVTFLPKEKKAVLLLRSDLDHPSQQYA